MLPPRLSSSTIKKIMAISKIAATTDLEYQKSLVEELDSMKMFDEILKLCEFYHVERCKYEDCANCLYVQNTAHEVELVAPLQKNGKMKTENFNCIRIRIFLKTLESIEKTS